MDHMKYLKPPGTRRSIPSDLKATHDFQSPYGRSISSIEFHVPNIPQSYPGHSWSLIQLEP